ncbi:MAG TPA: hypothetical protein VFJ06_08040 [Halococcus sp.]|nr:hypothetical protein [Halococcus sp.]
MEQLSTDFETSTDSTRRTFLAGAAASGLGLSAVGLFTQPVAAKNHRAGKSHRTGKNRRLILRGDAAAAANARPTTDEHNTIRGSWAVAGDGDGDGLDDKLFFWLAPETLPFGFDSFTVSDLVGVSYYTKTDHATGGTTPQNISLSIYTQPDGADDDASWYGYRLDAEPYFARALDAPPNQWNEWSTADGSNQLTFYDSNRTGVGFGFYGGQPTLRDLRAGPVNWANLKDGAEDRTIDYGAETVEAIVFTTGSGWTDDFEGYLDTIELRLAKGPGRSKKGQTLRIDLEP